MHDAASLSRMTACQAGILDMMSGMALAEGFSGVQLCESKTLTSVNRFRLNLYQLREAATR
jgi:hypothetical protein